LTIKGKLHYYQKSRWRQSM